MALAICGRGRGAPMLPPEADRNGAEEPVADCLPRSVPAASKLLT